MVACVLCGGHTVAVLTGRPDYEYGIAEKLDYHRCEECGLVFASPIPVQSIPSFYGDYSTHREANGSFLNRRARAQSLAEALAIIGEDRNLSILDYGCGNGAFLSELSAAGYRNLSGYDFDSKAIAAARAIGARVFESLDDLRGSFDVITANHVVEHLVDPSEELTRLAGLLRSGGVLLIRTPNAASFLARQTGVRWRGWETPRHLHIFTPRSITLLIERVLSLEIERRFTSNAMFFGIFHESFRSIRSKVVRHSLAFATYALTKIMPSREHKEELVVVARRR